VEITLWACRMHGTDCSLSTEKSPFYRGFNQ
jgi:hypothetical protein